MKPVIYLPIGIVMGLMAAWIVFLALGIREQGSDTQTVDGFRVTTKGLMILDVEPDQVELEARKRLEATLRDKVEGK